MVALEFWTFLGRFHPLIVHLPIGFLVLAILLEWLENGKKNKKNNKIIAVSWLVGGISAFAAAFCGWFLGDSGSYSEDNLFIHKWLGIALVVVAFAGWWIKKNHGNYSKTLHNSVNIALLVMLMVEGHKGGNITHGENYLVEHAPAPIQNLLSFSNKIEGLPQYNSPDSVVVYSDLIHPILESKCLSCHSNEIQRGDLNLASQQLFQDGGENGPVLAPGDPEESEIFQRITTSQKSTKFMPPKGNPMTYDEIKVMEWWINSGADFDKKVSDIELNESIKSVLIRLYGLDTNHKPWYESVMVSPIDTTQLDVLESNGFLVKSLGDENNLLDIKYSKSELTQEQIKALNGAKEHITWLSLAQSNVENEWLSDIGNFSNLTRLQLEKTAISDLGISALSNLEHLEVLNLYDTKVTDSCLQDLVNIQSLRRVYLWKTEVTKEAIASLQQDNPDLEFILGN
jgi:uncharacterized membrane protein